MLIKVKTLERGDVELEVGDDAPLSTLRTLIEERMGVPSSRQRLIFQGHPLLHNDRALKDYGIADGLTLHMVERPANVVPSGDGGSGDTHGRQRRPGSARRTHGATGDQPNRAEMARMNVINGEMTVVRGALFQDADAALELVRGALTNTLSSLSGSTSSEIELQEDAPRVGDLTLIVRIRGNAIRHAESGARERLQRATEMLDRNERAMNILDRGIVPYISALESGDTELAEGDAALIALDECVLELEEITKMPRAAMINQAEAMEVDDSQRTVPQTQSTAPSGDAAESTTATNASRVEASALPTYLIRHSTGAEYASMMQRLLRQQSMASDHMRRYSSLLNSGTQLANNTLSRYALVVYQEHVQRVLHRLAHVYHSLSDISIDFGSGVPSSSFLRPQCAHYDHSAATEVMLSITFLSPQGGHPGPLASSRHEVVNVTRSTSTPAQSAHAMLEAMTTQLRNEVGQQSPTTMATGEEPSTGANSDVPLATQPTTNATASADVQSNVAAATATAAPTAARVPCPPTQSQPLAPGYTRTPPALFTVANSSHAPHFLTTGVVPMAIPIPLQAAHFQFAPGQAIAGGIHASANSMNWENLRQQRQNGPPSQPPQEQNHNQTTVDRNATAITTTNTSATSTQPNGTLDAAAANAGIQQIFRNFFGGTLGNVWPSLSSQYTTHAAGGTASSQATDSNNATGDGASANPLAPSATRPHQVGAAAPMMHAFRAPFAPGIMGQVIVRTNGAANAEATRRAVDAAVHAANSAAAHAVSSATAHNAATAANGMHIHTDNVGPSRNTRNREAISWIRRAYANRASSSTQDAEAPSGMFVGPRFPHDSVIYTTDPYLPCQSRFCNPRSIVRNSADYENTITAIREAVMRSQSNLAAGSPEFEHAKSINARWNEVRGTDETDDHIVMNQRGEAVFERAEHFSSVIEVMIRRAVANMADTDSDVARELRAAYGEFETFNYSITPIVSTSMRAIGLPVPMIGPVELESLSADIEIEPMDDARRQQLMQMNVFENLTAQNANGSASNASDVPQTAQSQGTQQAPRDEQNAQSGEGDVDILEMVRALSNLMQSGRSVTLSQVMREMDQPVTRLESGFINLVLVMAYELLQVPELLHLFAGDFSAIYNNRVQIRRFIIENVFNDNSRPSEEDINSAAERVTLAESELDRFLSYDDVHRYADVAGVGKVDLVASVLRVEKRSITQLLHTFLQRDEEIEANEYSRRVVDLFADYVQRVVVLANLSMSGAPFDYETMLLRFMDQPSGTRDRQVVRWLSHMSVTHIRELLSRGTPFSVENMHDDFVVLQSETGDQPQNADESEKKTDSEQQEATDQQSSSSGRNDERSVEMANDVIEGDGDLADRVEDTAWRMALPQEWLPIIDGDRHRLASMAPQAALSDAYLCGSPIARKKAKKVDAEGESGDDTMMRTVNAALTEALMRAEQPVSHELTRGDHRFNLGDIAREEFDEAIVHRLQSDPDFEPEKFPELNKLYTEKREPPS